MRQAFQLVAMIISIALTPVVTNALGYSLTSILYGSLGGVVILYMALTARERKVEPHEEKPQLWSSIKSIISNRNFWIAGLTNAFYSAAMSLVLAGLPFFVKYTLQIPDAQSTILFASVLIIAILCVIFWAWLVRKYRLIPVWRVALGALAVSFIPLFFATDLISAIVGSILVGFGFAGVITTMDLIGARIMDEDQRKYNVRREGIYANAMGFMNRLSGLFTSLAFLLLFQLFEFESGDNPGTQPGTASRFLLTVFPLILMIVSLGFSFFLKFTQRQNARAGEIYTEEE
jgi:GPH family glycoside/pentoside/hexuronide:cation symporter